MPSTSTTAQAHPQLTKRKGMTVFKYTQVRKYRYIPPDFLLQMKSWFNQQKMKIKKNHRGPGHLSGRRDGIHINFVPKFLVSVKQLADHAEVTFTYAARIRKIGIATALLTEGLSLLIGAVTLSAHIAAARSFVDQVTQVMDSISGAPYEVDWVEATEAPGAETSTTTTTTTSRAVSQAPITAPVPAPTPVPIVAPPSPPVRAPAPLINLMDMSPVMSRSASLDPVQVPQQPQIFVVPQSTIVIHSQGNSYGMMDGMMPSHGSLQNGSAYPSGSSFATPFDEPQSQLPQITYMPSVPEVSLGEVTVPTMIERPAMLLTTRYPMPQQQEASAAPMAIEYAPSMVEKKPMMTRSKSITDIDPFSFSLNQPMFPKQQQQQPIPVSSYGSARN